MEIFATYRGAVKQNTPKAECDFESLKNWPLEERNFFFLIYDIMSYNFTIVKCIFEASET